jgi:succinate dehydrogenase / fumarate reductase flavoprotein subunit
MVARAMANEVREGRGAGPNKDYVLLDLTHLEPAVIDAKLPDITEFARTYLGVEPYTEPVPVFPTAHYAMGGIPTNIKAEVLSDNDTVIPGLYAAGECACVSVHGANRLGTNSLLDINVFGKRAGKYSVEYAKTAKQVPMPEDAAKDVLELLQKVRNAKGKEKVAQLRKELQETMDKNAQVFRTEETLNEALAKIAELRKRYEKISVQDQGKRFNTDLLEAVELGFLLDLAEVTVITCRERRESRGAHLREDYTERNDKKFMVHSMAYKQNKIDKKTGIDIKVDWKPVVITNYQPMERKY